MGNFLSRFLRWGSAAVPEGNRDQQEPGPEDNMEVFCVNGKDKGPEEMEPPFVDQPSGSQVKGDDEAYDEYELEGIMMKLIHGKPAIRKKVLKAKCCGCKNWLSIENKHNHKYFITHIGTICKAKNWKELMENRLKPAEIGWLKSSYPASWSEDFIWMNENIPENLEGEDESDDDDDDDIVAGVAATAEFVKAVADLKKSNRKLTKRLEKVEKAKNDPKDNLLLGYYLVVVVALLALKRP